MPDENATTYDADATHYDLDAYKSYCGQIRSLLFESGETGLSIAELHRCLAKQGTDVHREWTCDALESIHCEEIGALPIKYRLVEFRPVRRLSFNKQQSEALARGAVRPYAWSDWSLK